MPKTSLTHPLLIAEVLAGPGCGRVGVTFCPGKYDPHALSGNWERDLALDLDAVRAWGAAAVVTLLEPHELKLLRVERLGDEVKGRGMQWLHLPIADVHAPDAAFERKWLVEGARLRGMLRDGHDVLVHCRGGLGRAGTIAARLLAELGMAPRQAIAAVRAVRPNAIENAEQENWVLAARPVA
jgi:ADP-ribosyl-[dinitrogen reductase] hydrolase